MTGRWRAVAVLVVPLDSPAGRVAQAVEELATHLPPSGESTGCAGCASQLWPCAGFDEAASRLRAAGIPVGYWVPLDLHPRLWPPTDPPAPPTDTRLHEE